MPAAAEPLDAAEFARLVEPLGPFEPAPTLAVAASGGADSMALALLADAWARARGGRVVALTVDHGLRPESAVEAELTARRLAGAGIAGVTLPLGLARGPRLAERARAGRYAALQAACAARGILHLLLGHHAADQAETLAMRMLRGSRPNGLAGMSALVETAQVRLLRPLLGVPPVRLRATLRVAGWQWVEDPSNRDPSSLRARLRALRDDPGGTGLATRGAVAAARARGQARRQAEAADAAWLGRHATLHPDGYAVLDALPERTEPLAALLRAVAGRSHPPETEAVARWLAQTRPATLGGVMLRPGAAASWVLRREPAAVTPSGGAPGRGWWGRGWRAPSPLAGGGFVVG